VDGHPRSHGPCPRGTAPTSQAARDSGAPPRHRPRWRRSSNACHSSTPDVADHEPQPTVVDQGPPSFITPADRTLHVTTVRRHLDHSGE
jgi:hypothetical protein